MACMSDHSPQQLSLLVPQGVPYDAEYSARRSRMLIVYYYSYMGGWGDLGMPSPSLSPSNLSVPRIILVTGVALMSFSNDIGPELQI